LISGVPTRSRTPVAGVKGREKAYSACFSSHFESFKSIYVHQKPSKKPSGSKRYRGSPSKQGKKPWMVGHYILM
jgi:hypothetical protein